MAAAHLSGPEVCLSLDGCTGKAGWDSRADAMHVVRESRGFDKPYHCQTCGCWHLTALGLVRSRRRHLATPAKGGRLVRRPV